MKKEITVVEVNRIGVFPPVISLIYNLLRNDHKVNFIGTGLIDLPDEIVRNEKFTGIEIRDASYKRSSFILNRYIDRKILENKTRSTVIEQMEHSDILWTTSYNTVKILGDLVIRYKNVMQFMELADKGYLFKHIIKFPLDGFARKSWKVVVAEKNRAYIEKAIWGLDKLPYVLPNKPYALTTGEVTEDMYPALKVIQQEKRKIILYLGGIWADRDLKPFARAIQSISDKYCFYIIGKAYGERSEAHLKELIDNYDVTYLGGFTPPKHLEFVKYAHIGSLSYSPVSGDTISSLNALYCAPNKIYEYAAFGVPMIGNDVLGLQGPFHQYGIGVCCDDTDTESVMKGLAYIDDHYEEMRENCKKFYIDTDLDKIVNEILEDG